MTPCTLVPMISTSASSSPSWVGLPSVPKFLSNPCTDIDAGGQSLIRRLGSVKDH